MTARNSEPNAQAPTRRLSSHYEFPDLVNPPLIRFLTS